MQATEESATKGEVEAVADDSKGAQNGAPKEGKKNNRKPKDQTKMVYKPKDAIGQQPAGEATEKVEDMGQAANELKKEIKDKKPQRERKPKQDRPKTARPQDAGKLQENAEEAKEETTPGEGETPGEEAKERKNKGERKQRERKPKGEKQTQEGQENGDLEETKETPKPQREKRPKTAGANKEQNGNKRAGKDDEENGKDKRAGDKQDKDKKREPVDRSHQPTQYTPYKAKREYKSKYQEYMDAAWRRYRVSINVTEETVLPPMPLQLLKEPEDTVYHEQQVKFDEEIEQLKEELVTHTQDFNDRLGAMRAGQQGKSGVSKELRTHLDEMKKWQEKKRAIFKQREEKDKKITDLRKEQERCLKQCHPAVNSLDKMERGIRELEDRHKTTSLSLNEEKKIIAEIEKIKGSKPALLKRAEIEKVIQELRQVQTEDQKELPEIIKMIKGIQAQIDKVKEKDTGLQDDKAGHQEKLDSIVAQKKKLKDKIEEKKVHKNECKEIYYGKLVDYEVQQRLIKDIEWLAKLKVAHKERAERASKKHEEYLARVETRARLQAEKEKREEQRRQDEERNRQEKESKQKAWEEQQIKKLDVNPFMVEIDSCEHLIYFCARQRKDLKKASADQEESKAEAANVESRPKVNDQLKSGKLQEVEREVETDQERRKKGKKKRDGPSLFYYEDDSRLNLDYMHIKKFSKLGLSPPIDVEQLPNTQKQLQDLRDALKVAGQMDNMSQKAKIVKKNGDEGATPILESEEFLALQKEWDAVDKTIKKAIEVVRNEKQSSWTGDYDDNEERDSDEEIGARQFRDRDDDAARQFTKLAKNDGKKGDKKDKGDDKGARKQNQKKFNAESQDAFPSF